HAYVSLLLEFRQRWWGRSLPELRNGLYTDGPLNFVQEVPTFAKGCHVIRILLPIAERWLSRGDRDLIAFCLRHLRLLSDEVKRPSSSSIKRWRYGLPCGGPARAYARVSARPPIYMAGDRFAAWPSMSGALESGQRAGEAISRALLRGARDARL